MKKYIVAVMMTVAMALMFMCTAWAGKNAHADADLADASQGNRYLTFTAEEDDSSVTFNYTSGSNVMYSLDGGNTWKNYTEETAIELSKVGNSVCFKGTDVQTSYSAKFAITGKVAASGDVTSLTNGVGGDCNLADYCYQYMFEGCAGLTEAPELPATTLAEECYASMFEGCTGLTEAPELPATTLADSCYEGMFRGCTGLAEAPELPATTLAYGCYQYMFDSCTGLTEAPELPATTLAERCYGGMFGGCTDLTKAPELPAMTLAERCYYEMFYCCTGLTEAPELPATTLASSCYSSMFCYCTGLAEAPKLPATTLAERCYANMFGDCMGLTNAPELPAMTLADSCYDGMFSGCADLTKAPKLPATTLADSCYEGMFWSCSGLAEAPELPATTLAADCYQYMFFGCSGLTEAPELPATMLAERCYYGMFLGCTGLTEAPELPATTLASQCYSIMFEVCTGLTEAPKLPATTLASYCYDDMFDGCTGLTEAPELPATTLAEWCYSSMFSGCTGLTEAPELPATTLADGCYQYMFDGCTGLTEAPELPATTLADYCYEGMFSGCAGLMNVPKLSARMLAKECYSYMFANCSNICISTEKTGDYSEEWSIPSGSYTADSWNSYMFSGTGGTFQSDPEAGQTYYYQPRVDPKLVAVESVKLDNHTVSMATSKAETKASGDIDTPYTITSASTLQLTATVSPAGATDKTLIWTSSDENIASVDENGLVTAYKFSKNPVTITVSSADGKCRDTCTIQTRYWDVAGNNQWGTEGYQYWFNPVYWAADNGITAGYQQVYFGAELNCTRGALAVFLWRLAGKPSVSNVKNPFNDVDKEELGNTYYNAILWAYSKGITKGYSDGGFHPNDQIVRKDVMIMIYRFAGKPTPVNTKVPSEMTFADVVGTYKTTSDTYKAIQWAYYNGITGGYTSGPYTGQFGCNLNCLRKDIVTFLYRYNNLKK